MDPFHLPAQGSHPQLSHYMEPGSPSLFIREHFNLLELSRLKTCPQCLAEGFLGRKPGRIRFTAVGSFLFTAGDFLIGERFLLEAFLLQSPFDPSHF